jgi:hypothetical protein
MLIAKPRGRTVAALLLAVVQGLACNAILGTLGSQPDDGGTEGSVYIHLPPSLLDGGRESGHGAGSASGSGSSSGPGSSSGSGASDASGFDADLDGWIDAARFELDADDAGDATIPDGACVPVTVPTGTSGATTCPTPTTGKCAPGSLSGFLPGAPRPSGLRQGKCTVEQITSIYNGCFGPNATTAACNGTDAGECYSCIVSEADAATWGPFVETTGSNSFNWGGCLELLEPCNWGCAEALENQLECDLAACGTNCPLTADGGSVTAYSNCVNTVDTCDPGGCYAYYNAANCIYDVSGPHHPGAVCFQETFEGFYNAAAPLFCGP